MNRIEFMNRLNALLRDIPAEERNEALQYYADYFDDAGPDNEMLVTEELGNPEKVAAIIKAGLNGQNGESGEYRETGYTDPRFEQKSMPAYQKNQSGQEEEPKMNSLLKALLIIGIILIGIPVILPLAIGALAVAFSMVFAVFVLFAALLLTAVVITIASVIIFCVGLTKIVIALPVAFMMMGSGMIFFVLGLICSFLMIRAIIIVIPGLCRGLAWICRRPFQGRAVA